MQEMSLQEFGGRLLRLMAINSISEAEILLQLSVDQNTYDKWVTGQVVPSESDVTMLEGYFGCNRRWLASGEGEPYVSPVGSGTELGPDDEKTGRGNGALTGECSLADPAMQEMAVWIAEQRDGINYWEVVKAKLAREYPEFREWLKKRRQGRNSLPVERGRGSTLDVPSVDS